MGQRLDKPIRLYALAVFVVVGYGFLPLVSVFPFTGGFLLVGPRILPYNGSIQILYGSSGEASILMIIITLSLGAFAAFSSFLAAAGVREGRTATLLLLTLDVLWWYLVVIIAIVENSDQQQFILEAGSQLLFPPFFLAAVCWNYTRPEIGAYYRYLDQLQD